MTAPSVEDLARAVIQAIAAGQPAIQEREALAAAVLEGDELVRLALLVREGGEHAIRRALELAGRVITRPRARRATPSLRD